MLDALLIGAALIGVGCAVFLIARSPAFWLGLVLVIWKAAKPHVIRYLSTPLSPEDQKKLDETRRRAEEWDHFRRRPRSR